MKVKSLNLSYNIFDSIRDKALDQQYLPLINAAKSACNLAHAPYSNFKVGAAVMMKDNDAIIQGANQENAAYPMCTCAEQVAIYNAAILHPGVPVKALAVHVNVVPTHNRPPSPCGACRQVILETELKYGGDIQIFISSQADEVFLFPNIKSLLPFYFSGDDLG